MLLAQQGGWGGAELYWIIICLKLIMACQMIHTCSLSMAVHIIYYDGHLHMSAYLLYLSNNKY